MGNFDTGEFAFSKERNEYFDFSNPAYDREKDLYSTWITEAINKFGVCMEYYAVSYDLQYDPIWGEDNNRRYERKFDFMTYFQLPRENKMWTNLGLENVGNLNMFVSKKHFSVASNVYGSGEHIPKIGDIVMSKYSSFVYEITEVVEGSKNFLQSKQHVWEFVCKPFVDEGIDNSSVSGTSISAVSDKRKDIFDVTDFVDAKKEDIIYIPKDTEKPNQDPWAKW